MSDNSTPVRKITIDGQDYPLRFGQNTLYELEMRLSEMEDERIAKGGKPRSGVRLDPVTNKMILVALKGIELLQHLPERVQQHLSFWAALEGARIDLGTRAKPYTMQEAGQLIDKAGIEDVTLQTNLAFSEAFPGRFSKEYLDNLLKLDEARKNGPPAPESAPVPENQITDKPGKSGSSKGSRRASPSVSSGA